MKPESLSPTLDQQFSGSPSAQLAPVATGARGSQQSGESAPRRTGEVFLRCGW